MNTVKRKLLTKKKSLELSFENIKILKNRTASQSITQQHQTTSPAKQNDSKLISSISEYTLSRNEPDEEVSNHNDESLKLKDTSINKIASKTERQEEVEMNKLFPDNENEFLNNVENKNKKLWILNDKNNKYKIIFISIISYYFINNSPFLIGLALGILITSLISFCYFKLNFKSQDTKGEFTREQKLEEKTDKQYKLFVGEKCDKNFCGVYKVIFKGAFF